MYTIRSVTNFDIPWMQQAFLSLNIPWQDSLDGFIAEEGERKVGLITYQINEKKCQIISVNSLTPGKGIGGALLEKVEIIAKEKECTEIVANIDATTKDFFLKNGFTERETQLQKTF